MDDNFGEWVKSMGVASPFNSRLTSVFLERSGVKRTMHGRFVLAHTIYRYPRNNYYFPCSTCITCSSLFGSSIPRDFSVHLLNVFSFFEYII